MENEMLADCVSISLIAVMKMVSIPQRHRQNLHAHHRKYTVKTISQLRRQFVSLLFFFIV